jgi:nitrous oxidase accessory protein NosD
MRKAMVTLFVLLLLSAAFIQVSELVSAQNSSVIRIKADGTVAGTDKIKQEGLVYTITGDLYASVGQSEAFIFIEKEDIILNGAGYTIQGTGVGSAIYMLRSQNVTVKNCVIRGFSRGIDFGIVENWPSGANYLNQPSAHSNQIRNNRIEVSPNAGSNQTRDAGWCIYLNDATQTVIADNNFICHNPNGGVYLGNSVKEASLLDNDFFVGGIYSLKSDRNRAQGNTIDGNPLIYMDSESDKVITEAGLVYLFNCSNIVIKNVYSLYAYALTIQLVDTVKSEISNSSGHILLVNSNDTSIHNNQLTSILLDASSYNQVFDNTIMDFSVCVKLYRESSFNKIYNNLLLDTIYSSDAVRVRKEGFNTAAIQLGDIQLGGAFNNDIYNNIIINHDNGFECFLSSNNTLTANIIKDCKTGIQFGKSHYNTATENNITACKYALSMYAESSNNTFYHNNFINNQIQYIETNQPNILSDRETYVIGNTLDNGKTGNYWDTYTGIDANGDGIGDTPYQVFGNMTDHYPLMEPFKNAIANNPPPTYSSAERPVTNGETSAQRDKENKILIITACIILGIIGGLIIYFRRLIFR